METIIPRDS